MIKESKYAIFEYDRCDENLINDLINYLDNNQNRIKCFFDENLELPKIKIKIYSAKKEYDEKVGIKMFDGEVPKWVIGSYNNGMINYVSFNDFKNTSHQNDSYESYLKTLIHEYIHFVTNEYSKKINCEYPIKYISEGIAYYLSGQGNKIEYSDNISEDDILNGKSCYPKWYLFVKYIIDIKGKEYFFELFKDKVKAKKDIETLVLECNGYYKCLEKLMFDEINSPEELLEFMDKNITYGFLGKNGKKYTDMYSPEWNDWYDECFVQSGEEVLKSKIGTCWDQVELERLWFEKNNYNFKTIFIWFEVNRENNFPTHAFLIYEDNNK